MEYAKIPPHDIEAEQAVLGAMLVDKDAVMEALESLKTDSFYREDHKIIFEAIYNVNAKGDEVDFITVKDELISMQKLDSVGGLAYLSELPTKVPTTANIKKYIKIVEDKSLLRNLILVSNELIALGYNQNEEIDSIMDLAENKIFSMMQKKNQKGYDTIENILTESLIEIQEIYNNKKAKSGIPSGFVDLDNITSGFHKSDLVIIAARPSMGKTAFALNIATNAAVMYKVPVAVFSLEMTKEQCGNRILCSQAMVDSFRFNNGDIKDEEWKQLFIASEELVKSGKILIDDTTDLTIAELKAKCRKMKIEYNIGMVVIDYLQLIVGSGRTNSREQEIAEISRSLKMIAKEIKVPVIALSQLSRGSEARADHRPMLQDLRESGSIEQDADMVMFIYRRDYYERDKEPTNTAEIIVAKNRNGPVDTAELVWMKQYTKFANKFKE